MDEIYPISQSINQNIGDALWPWLYWLYHITEDLLGFIILLVLTPSGGWELL